MDIQQKVVHWHLREQNAQERQEKIHAYIQVDIGEVVIVGLLLQKAKTIGGQYALLAAKVISEFHDNCQIFSLKFF